MVLTSSDIGISPYEVESNLTRHFKQARSWGAVLLIDEADVFMERRSTADLNRNSLVAGTSSQLFSSMITKLTIRTGFLRALEFYDGILFLTTNRVGAFDDAFISRIHIQLYYPEFDDVSRRKVWKTFIDKLRRERGDYIRLNIDAREYLEGKELRAVKWNGREIRNGIHNTII
jgi:SpoVK/Ycf46/Vps4 family AAA+-type ATPase